MAKKAKTETAPRLLSQYGRRMFALEAPQAVMVLLAGDFTQWGEHPIVMRRGTDGWWRTEVELAPGAHHYRFLVDGQWCDDPGCTARVPNDFGTQNCVCEVS